MATLAARPPPEILPVGVPEPADPPTNSSAAAPVIKPPGGEELWEAVKAVVSRPWEHNKDSEVPSALVVFDWDDTILPTAALVAAKRIAPAPGHPGEAATSGARACGLLNDWDFDSYLEACGVAALQALQKAKQFGRVVIITNSGFGWVHETAVRFMPLLLSELEDIPVISARSIFEPLGVQEPYRWKVLCFRRIVDCFTFDASGKTGPSCLISIGDGWQERVAAMIAGQDVEACVKCIKFLEQPGVDQLARELDLCSQVFEGLCGHPSWVDACYSYSKTWGLQLEARADDTSALGGSFAAVEGTVEVVSTDTVEDAGMDHVGSNMTEAEAPVGAPTDRPAEKDEEGIPWQRLESRRKPGLFYYFNPLDGSREIKPPVVKAPWQLCRSRSVSGQYYYYNQVTGESTEIPPRCALPNKAMPGQLSQPSPARSTASAPVESSPAGRPGALARPSSKTKATSQDDDPLPEGWERVPSTQYPDKCYYRKIGEQETQWERPTAPARPTAPRRDGPDWERRESTSMRGKFYWYNARTNETVWDEG
mmetsp:Transcript_91797/g.218714  ORF Transcript_91797/g.218714 Transcript_91797/m.218714 type:complete len:539 (+) Transcript_91797:131-1747(+)